MTLFTVVALSTIFASPPAQTAIQKAQRLEKEFQEMNRSFAQQTEFKEEFGRYLKIEEEFGKKQSLLTARLLANGRRTPSEETRLEAKKLKIEFDALWAEHAKKTQELKEHMEKWRKQRK